MNTDPKTDLDEMLADGWAVTLYRNSKGETEGGASRPEPGGVRSCHAKEPSPDAASCIDKIHNDIVVGAIMNDAQQQLHDQIRSYVAIAKAAGQKPSVKDVIVDIGTLGEERDDRVRAMLGRMLDEDDIGTLDLDEAMALILVEPEAKKHEEQEDRIRESLFEEWQRHVAHEWGTPFEDGTPPSPHTVTQVGQRLNQLEDAQSDTWGIQVVQGLIIAALAAWVLFQ